jgi:hypothetical protein
VTDSLRRGNTHPGRGKFGLRVIRLREMKNVRRVIEKLQEPVVEAPTESNEPGESVVSDVEVDRVSTPMSLNRTASSEQDRFAFISYSRADKMRVIGEVSAIRSLGFSVWIDEKIRPTSEWPETIGHAVQACSLFVLYVTAKSIESRNVRNEVNLAIDEGKPVLAIHLEQVELSPGLRLRLGDIQAIHKHDLSPDRYTSLVSETFSQTLRSDPKPLPKPDPSETGPRDDVDFGQLGL